ncbi:DUF427 domain-containing protein [Sesbania bispinosa]|nr:DUF427 domain-containing protein [Sesbania bispinosa]
MPCTFVARATVTSCWVEWVEHIFTNDLPFVDLMKRIGIADVVKLSPRLSVYKHVEVVELLQQLSPLSNGIRSLWSNFSNGFATFFKIPTTSSRISLGAKTTGLISVSKHNDFDSSNHRGSASRSIVCHRCNNYFSEQPSAFTTAFRPHHRVSAVLGAATVVQNVSSTISKLASSSHTQLPPSASLPPSFHLRQDSSVRRAPPPSPLCLGTLITLA